MSPDVVVIGGGAAGIAAARTARSRGASVVLVERARIGGDCTFTGCVPSKAMIEAVDRGAGFVEAMAWVHRAVEQVAAAESASVLRNEGIDVLEGAARFAGPHTVDVDGRSLEADRVVVATGAGPAVPQIPGLGEGGYLTNETLFDIASLPESLAVLGGGPVGVEMAQAFARLGSAVTIVEGVSRLLPREEPLASLVIEQTFAREGISIRTGSAVHDVQRLDRGSRVRLHLNDGSHVEAKAFLVAVGRTPAIEGLGLDTAGVAVDGRGFIKVDDRLRTTARGIFAAGDVAQPLQFTHVAYETGRIAALNALSRAPLRRFRQGAVPWVTFTNPEVARVGLTEAEAASRGGRVAFVPMNEVDRAVAAGRTEGFLKIIVGPRRLSRSAAGGRILGATIVAPRAGEMIHEVVLAMRAGIFPARLALATHAYPTWSVAIQQAAAQFFGEFGGRSARPASVDAVVAAERQALAAGGPMSAGAPGTVCAFGGFPR